MDRPRCRYLLGVRVRPAAGAVRRADDVALMSDERFAAIREFWLSHGDHTPRGADVLVGQLATLEREGLIAIRDPRLAGFTGHQTVRPERRGP